MNAITWTVAPTDEDVHSKIEALLVERLGEPGKKLHTGRGRNDQVLTAGRLYLKDNLLAIGEHIRHFVQALMTQAQRYQWTPLSYTHLQRGMPSDCGQ